jgi:hypothetical protein
MEMMASGFRIYTHTHTHTTHKEIEKEKANPLHAMALNVMASSFYRHTQTQHIRRRLRDRRRF